VAASLVCEAKHLHKCYLKIYTTA